MKLGDEVYVHGYVDEIRKDCVIVKNKGGYFGTVQEEATFAKGQLDEIETISHDINFMLGKEEE